MEEHDLEPIREWLDIKENRRGSFGSTGKEGVGDYYCIPVDVLIKCGMSIDEVFHGKTHVEDMEFNRNHLCAKCEQIASSLNNDGWCSMCVGIERAK